MLLANYAQVNRNCASDFGQAFTNPHAFLRPQIVQNFYVGNAVVTGETKKSGFQNGYSGSYAWLQPMVAGGLSASRTANLGITGTASGALGRNIEGSSTITFDVPNASLQLIVSASGDASFSITTTAEIAGALQALGAAYITWTAGVQAPIQSPIAGDSTFSIVTNSPLLGAIASGIASATITMTGEGTVRATGSLSGDITPYTELSPQTLSSAVWEALAANFGTAGTMGALLNAAGSGGMDPALVQKIEEVWQLMGLDSGNPLSVSTTERLTGAIAQAIEESGGVVTVTRA